MIIVLLSLVILSRLVSLLCPSSCSLAPVCVGSMSVVAELGTLVVIIHGFGLVSRLAHGELREVLSLLFSLGWLVLFVVPVHLA